MRSTLTISLSLLFLSACAPEVGSERWCKQLEETPKGEWSLNDATEYTKSCLLEINKE